jgi:hypothetical protein
MNPSQVVDRTNDAAADRDLLGDYVTLNLRLLANHKRVAMDVASNLAIETDLTLRGHIAGDYQSSPIVDAVGVEPRPRADCGDLSIRMSRLLQSIGPGSDNQLLPRLIRSIQFDCDPNLPRQSIKVLIVISAKRYICLCAVANVEVHSNAAKQGGAAFLK